MQKSTGYKSVSGAFNIVIIVHDELEEVVRVEGVRSFFKLSKLLNEHFHGHCV